MDQGEHKTPKLPPARIHLLAARAAPRVIVIRRKPSRVVHILRWNTLTDELEPGSWFRGRLYEMRSDVSFDGEWMAYLVMGSTGGTWTGICRPPFLRTEVHWENAGTWNGGGVFTQVDRLEMNAGHMAREMREAMQSVRPSLPFRVEPMARHGYGEDEGVLYPRFARDGYRRLGPFGESRPLPGREYTVLCVDDPGWEVRPSETHPRLRVRYRGYYGGRGRVFEFDLPECPGILDPKVSWAAYDALGQLVFARGGVLYRYTREGLNEGNPSAVLDLEPLVAPERSPEARAEAKAEAQANRPRIRVVTGPLEDQPVRALVIPAARVPWADRVRELAGPHLQADLASRSGTSPLVFVTPAYYLRQHDLVHVNEPDPSTGPYTLHQLNGWAFGAAARASGLGMALRPVGLAAGWSLDEAARATLDAARRYVAEDPDRDVLLVAADDEEAAALQALLEA